MKRRPKKNARREQVILRCTAIEKAAWFAMAAQSVSGEFSEWARMILNQAALR
jgi:hypothetical protein